MCHRDGLARVVRAQFAGEGYVRVANARHPGVQAPLGWVLSKAARDDLYRQMQTATQRACPLIFPSKAGKDCP
jgi:hypothetical protein